MTFSLRAMARGLALVAGLCLAQGAAAQSEPVGFVAGTQGTVDVQSSGVWGAASIDGSLYLGDTVRTGPASAMKVVLADDTVLSIGEETEMKIDRFVVGSAATQEKSVLELLRGQMRVQVGDAFGGTTNLETHTPTAVIGVKGTIFEALVALNLLTVCDWEGKVFVELKNGKGRKDLDQGLCTEGYDELSDPFAIPPGFKSVGSGPTAGIAISSADVGSMVETTPPVAGGPDDGLDIPDLGDGDDIIDNNDAPGVEGDDALDAGPGIDDPEIEIDDPEPFQDPTDDPDPEGFPDPTVD